MRSKPAYRVFSRGQNLFNHHTVPSKGAPVQCVGPIRTEGAEATCYQATQRRGQQQATGRGRHNIKHKAVHYYMQPPGNCVCTGQRVRKKKEIGKVRRV